MATINKTIASSGADYTSASLFEASIPGSGADTYIGTYTEALSDTTPLATSFGSSNTMELDVQDAYRCKGAVSGSHAELRYEVANDTDTTDLALCTVRNLRIVRKNNTTGAADAVNIVSSSTNFAILDRCTIITDTNVGRAVRILNTGAGVATVKGCFIVDRNRPVGGAGVDVVFLRSTGAVPIFYRNTIFLANNTADSLLNANLTGTSVDARQNMLIKAAGATATNGCYYASSSGAYSGSCSANASSGTDTPENTTANENLAPGDVLTTLTVGSENLHYPSRANMLALTAGSSLSGTVGTVDLDGDTINAWYPGADYAYGIPTMTLVSPSSGPTAGGTAATLTGTNFTGVTGVTFGGTAATNVVVVNDTSITCDTPAHAAGAVSVLATNADGSNTANSAYTYNAAASGIAGYLMKRFRFGLKFGF